MEAIMTVNYRDKYFDEKFKNVTDSIANVRADVKVNTRMTREASQKSDQAKKLAEETAGHVHTLKEEVETMLGTKNIPKHSASIDAKSIGIAIGTAVGIISAAILAFKQVLGL